MKRTLLIALFGLLSSPLFAQPRASMSAPVIKSTVESVTITTDFNNFVAGEEYRVAIATMGVKLPKTKIELSRGGQSLSLKPTTFNQGYADSWFGADSVLAKGFFLKASELPPRGEKVTFRVIIPRSEAKLLKKAFIFVARQYGPQTWYIEDGSEMDDTYW